MFQAEQYVKSLTGMLKESFGERLLYVGLQGSYCRGEATENSDIDIMAVFDELKIEDMNAYRQIIAKLEQPELSCGFICGRDELAHWNPCEIFHLVQTTKDFYGALAPLVPSYSIADIVNHVKIGIGNLYHELCHGYIHGTAEDFGNRLTGLYKAVFFILQNLAYLRTGQFVKTKLELLALLEGADREVLSTALQISKENEPGYERAQSLLFNWCKNTLHAL